MQALARTGRSWRGQRPWRSAWLHAEASVDAQLAPNGLRAGPLGYYRDGVDAGRFRGDPQQLLAVTKLQRLWDDLRTEQPARDASRSGLTLVGAVEDSPWSLWAAIAGRLQEPAPLDPVRGLYLYGGVGTGKTFLMDMFHATLPSGLAKKRIHFLDFMLDVHRRLRGLAAVADPLEAVAREYTRADRGGSGRLVLCLDEFQVTDVADAMLLKRLFQHLFAQGAVLVSTSNRAPPRLYENGLQRQLFLPFIALLQQQCEVHDIAGLQDYRRLARKLSTTLYFTGPGAHGELLCCFPIFAPGQTPAPATVDVMMGRTLAVPMAAGPVAYFTFSQLCEQPVAAQDFIALCGRYHTILLDGVPRLGAATRAAAYRLVSLVDVVYEQRARLVLAADAQPAELFQLLLTQAELREARAAKQLASLEEVVVDDVVGFAKERTISRLIEMQSVHYSRQHATRHAPELLPSLPAENATVV